jgi:hypothetical protein
VGRLEGEIPAATESVSLEMYGILASAESILDHVMGYRYVNMVLKICSDSFNRAKALNLFPIGFHFHSDEFIVYTFYNQTTSLTDKVIQTPQDLTNPGTVIQYLEPNDPERACVSLNRALVGAKEIDFSILQNEVNDLVHVKQLDTLRFRYHNDWDARLNGRNKVMLNVQYVNHTAFVKTPHRPARNLECFFTPTKKSSFYLKHYISSWEAFSFRDDSRRYRERSYAAWHSRAFQTSKHYDDSIVSWLDGFVQNVGKEKALALLQNSGLPLDYNASHKVQDYYCLYGCRSSPSPLPTPQPVR